MLQAQAARAQVRLIDAGDPLDPLVTQDHGVHAAPRAGIHDARKPLRRRLRQVGGEVAEDEHAQRLRDLAGLLVVVLDARELVAQVLLDDRLHVLGEIGQLLLDVAVVGPDALADQLLMLIGKVHEAREALAEPHGIDDREAHLARRHGREHAEHRLLQHGHALRTSIMPALEQERGMQGEPKGHRHAKHARQVGWPRKIRIRGQRPRHRCDVKDAMPDAGRWTRLARGRPRRGVDRIPCGKERSIRRAKRAKDFGRLVASRAPRRTLIGAGLGPGGFGGEHLGPGTVIDRRHARLEGACRPSHADLARDARVVELRRQPRGDLGALGRHRLLDGGQLLVAPSLELAEHGAVLGVRLGQRIIPLAGHERFLLALRILGPRERRLHGCMGDRTRLQRRRQRRVQSPATDSIRHDRHHDGQERSAARAVGRVRQSPGHATDPIVRQGTDSGTDGREQEPRRQQDGPAKEARQPQLSELRIQAAHNLGLLLDRQFRLRTGLRRGGIIEPGLGRHPHAAPRHEGLRLAHELLEFRHARLQVRAVRLQIPSRDPDRFLVDRLGLPDRMVEVMLDLAAT